MTTWYIDPTWTGTASGTFAQPYTSPASIVTLTYGDSVLFKERTSNAAWTLPSISGTGSDSNRLYIGTYDAVNGNVLVNYDRMAIVNGASASDAIFSNGKSHITVCGLYFKNIPNFPNAGFRALAASNITVQSCRVNCGKVDLGKTPGLAYGIVLNNPTGTGATQSNWKVLGNWIENTTGNDGIICVWGANANEYVSGITVIGNYITGVLSNTVGGSGAALRIKGRATTYSSSPSTLKARNVIVKNNILYNIPGYGLKIEGVYNDGNTATIVSDNLIIENGDGLTDGHCIHLSAVDGGIVENNVVRYSQAWIGQSSGTQVGIFIDKPGNGSSFDTDGSTNLIIRNNLIQYTGQGGSLNTEVGGAGIAVLLSQKIKIYGNIVYGCSNGIVVMGWYGSGTKSQTIEISNNTVVDSQNSNYYICKAADLVTLKNNISSGAKRGFYIENSGAYALTNYTETYNVSYGATLFNWCGGNEPTTSPATISTRTPDVSCQTVDPLFVNPKLPWYGLSASSSILTAGTYLDISDYSGKRLANPPPIGATQNFTDRSISNRTVTLVRGVRA